MIRCCVMVWYYITSFHYTTSLIHYTTSLIHQTLIHNILTQHPHYSGPIQWARGKCALKRSVAARPWTLAGCRWRAAAPGLAARPMEQYMHDFCMQTKIQ